MPNELANIKSTEEMYALLYDKPFDCVRPDETGFLPSHEQLSGYYNGISAISEILNQQHERMREHLLLQPTGNNTGEGREDLALSGFAELAAKVELKANTWKVFILNRALDCCKHALQL
ncbi:MAG: hypothetical protein Q9174_004843 [Haloplaca sp. 1 TL-2023]